MNMPCQSAKGDKETMFGISHDKVFYGWMVAAAGFVLSLIGLGTRYSFGVFVKSIEGDFALSRGAVSGIFSVYMLLCCIFAVVGGWASDRYGPKRIAFLMSSFTGLSLLLTSQAIAPWQLLITYGLFLSLGTGPLFTVVNSTASRWFHRKRGLVLGITSSGGGLGAILMAPLATYLISHFDWRTAFIVTGIIAWFFSACMSLLLRKDPRDIGLLPDGDKSESDPTGKGNEKKLVQTDSPSALQALKTSQFWFLAFGWLCVSLSMHLIFVHVVPYALEMGIASMDAAIIIGLIGSATVIGRLFFGKVSDSIGRKIPAIACGFLQVGALVWLIWAGDLWMFYAFALGFGISAGGLGTMITILIGDVFGMQSIGAIMGMMSAGWALGAASGPAIAGYIFDFSGHYSLAFGVAAGAVMLATLFVALVRREIY
jgi:MFS family permease